MSNINAGNCEYRPLGSDALQKGTNDILNCWEDFISRAKTEYNKSSIKFVKWGYAVDNLALKEIVERVHQRKDYFFRYHFNMQMSEFKEIGLNMFWLTKFHPFRILDENIEAQDAFGINEEFAMFYMLSSLKNFALELQEVNRADIEKGEYDLQYNPDLLTGNLYDEILYSLSFRDISKEAFGIIVELVAHIVIPDLKLLSED